MTDVLLEPSALQLREKESSRDFLLRDVEWRDSGNGKEYTFVGQAAVYNSWSDMLWTPRGSFRERFLPGAFSDVLAGQHDVRFLLNHDKNLVLGRTASGTLELTEEGDCLRVHARVAKTTYATDLKLVMDRGDIDQMSVAFELDYDAGAEDRWYEDKATGIICHDVMRASDLFDCSVVTFPAYTSTSAAMRDLQRAIAQGVIPEYMLTPQEDGFMSTQEVRERERITIPTDRYRQAEQRVRNAPNVSVAELSPRAYRRCREAIEMTPWAMHPAALQLVLALMEERVTYGRPSDEEIRDRIGIRRDNTSTVQGDVAVVSLIGPVMTRAAAMSTISGAKSLDDFRAEFRQALNDPDISAIVLDIDSPGGTVSGVPEMANEIKAARGQKPLIAVANYLAASAAYWIACACDEVVASPSAEVGSVGVYAAHTDRSGELEQKGQKVTLIHYGENKVEMSPFSPLTDEAKANVQSEVDAIGQDFVGFIAKARGVPTKDVQANFGQGRTKMARPAQEAGMIDRIATLDQVVNDLTKGSSHKRDLMVPTGNLLPALMEAAAREFDRQDKEAEDAEADGKDLAAIPYAKTPVVDKPWDAAANVRRCRAEARALRGLHAWVDSGADENLKGSYKFPHHEVDGAGSPGAANVNGVRNGLTRLPGSKIPEADKPGVQAHLQRHLDDYHGSRQQAESLEESYWVLDRKEAHETMDAAREFLGIDAYKFVASAGTDPTGNGSVAEAETDPLGLPGDVAQAETDPVGDSNPVVALRERSAARMQAAREDRVNLTKEMLK